MPTIVDLRNKATRVARERDDYDAALADGHRRLSDHEPRRGVSRAGGDVERAMLSLRCAMFIFLLLDMNSYDVILCSRICYIVICYYIMICCLVLHYIVLCYMMLFSIIMCDITF